MIPGTFPAPVALLLLFSLLASPAAARQESMPPTDQQVAAAVTRYEKGRSGTERADPRIALALKEIPIDRLSAAQFERLGIMLDLAPPELRARFRARLQHLAQDPSADGAAAAAQLPRLFDMPGEDAEPGAAAEFERARAQSIVDAADHPGFAAAVRAGRATGIYLYAYFYVGNEALRQAGTIRKLASLVDDSWPLAHVDSLTAFAEAAISPESGLVRAETDRIREVASRRIQKVLELPETDEATRDGLLQALHAINSAAARGQLVGRDAPPINFLWTSTRGTAQPQFLADFKGKIVVIDFWATWCGPCVAAFPHMRDLQSRYKDSPVVLLGLTGLQGWILDPKAEDPAKRRVRGLSPDDEVRKLAQWAKDMNMTWTVAVSRENLFNPDYGIRGIPTIVVIDPAGVVKRADLAPTDPALTDLIDSLLKEAGAIVPPRPEPKPEPSRP